MGVAWHGHYLVWFELGRTELMRESGIPYGALEDKLELYFPVIAADVRYLASARYDEVLTVETRVERVGRVRVRFAYRLRRESVPELLATGHTEHAAVGKEGRPTRMPEEVRGKLETWQQLD
jgi:acyl-CoA thioester hydrolase